MSYRDPELEGDARDDESMREADPVGTRAISVKRLQEWIDRENDKPGTHSQDILDELQEFINA